jgi:glycosyltransferase involved in cell wall biosynthesis
MDGQVDVVVLTKNSESTLRACLESVYQNVPVKRLIVLDALSTDSTPKIVEQFDREYGNVVFVSEGGSRGYARQRGIEMVETDWFMFVDSDVVLCRDWFRRALRYVEDDVGAVWGVNIDFNRKVKSKSFLKLIVHLARQCFNVRGGMHDTLIRREAVDGIRIPEWLHTYEDAYIVNWIRSRGYKVVVGDDIYCLHYRPSRYYTFRESLRSVEAEIKYGLAYSRLYGVVAYYPILAINWMLQALDKRFGRT